MSEGLTAVASAAGAAAVRSPGVVSRDARSVARALLEAPVEPRRQVLRELSERELGFVLSEVRRDMGTVYHLWHDTPSGFVEDVLGETIWSKQRAVLDAVLTHKRVAVPAGFGVGKTHLAGRQVAWFVCVNPPGTALCVTTATRFRQVQNQLWPHIRRVHARAGLPGDTNLVEWWMPDGNDVRTLVAYGFSAPENDEAAMQGIHAARLLLVVDEAGGIARTIGNGTNNLLTGDARMLAIGNPPSNDPRSWFEGLCEEGEDPEHPTTVTIPIATLDSPAITGEVVPDCRDCPDGVPAHSLATHLPDQDWVTRTINEYGEDHPYVVAKVFAKFPKGGGNTAIPVNWVEAAQAADDPEPGVVFDGEQELDVFGLRPVLHEFVRLNELGLPGETGKHVVARKAWVRLGVDVAADGGDELAISRCVGDLVTEEHVSSGSENAHVLSVAEKILEHIGRAELLAAALGTEQPVRVKIDKNGLGWGVVGILEQWGKAGRHSAEIIGVMVSESPETEDEAAVMRPARKRDEMWLSGRWLLQPDVRGAGRLRLRVSRKAGIQLSTPRLEYNSAGYVVIESKKKMRDRGMHSPDRAESALLAVYEPYPIRRKKYRGLLV